MGTVPGTIWAIAGLVLAVALLLVQCAHAGAVTDGWVNEPLVCI